MSARDLLAQAWPRPWTAAVAEEWIDVSDASGSPIFTTMGGTLAAESANAALAARAVNEYELLLDVADAARAVWDHDDNDPAPLRPKLEAMYELLSDLDALRSGT